MEMRTETVLAATVGVVGFAFTVLGALMAGEFDDPIGGDPSIISEFFQGATFDAQFVSGVILETLGFLLIMAFVGKIADVVRGGTRESRWPGTVIVASVVVAVVFTMVTIVALGAGTFRAANGGLAGDGYVVLADVRLAAYWLSLLAWALVYLTSGAMILRGGSFPVWLGWAALVIGAGHVVVPFFASVDMWNVATGLGGLWLLVTAVHMLAKPGRYSVSGTAGDR